MARVTIKTGLMTPDGREEELTAYLCDYPECPNIATHILGPLGDIDLMVAVCELHASELQS